MEAFHEQLVKIVSKQRGVDEIESMDIIRKCIFRVAAQQSINSSQVRKMVFSQSFLEACIFGECGEMTVAECQKSCHCVEYEENKCISRYISDAYIINRDPDKYAKSLKTPELEELINRAAYLYHNYEGGGLSDNAFDGLEFNLNRRLKRRQRQLIKVGAQTVPKLRAELPMPMASLNKVYPGTKQFTQFINNNPSFEKEIIWSSKLDGISGLIVYDKGKVKSVFTRGDGTIGGDVTYVKNHVRHIPAEIKEYTSLIVRGEFVVSRETFRSKYSELYSTSRNFVNGQIASGHITSFINDIDFVAYEIMQIEGGDKLPNITSRYGVLELEGFKVVSHGTLPKQNLIFDTLMLYKNKRLSSEYDIDGLVLAYDISLEVAQILKNPVYAVAFKAILEEQIRDTEVTDVEWNISRYGRYVPVAIYEAVYINGTRLHRASAHNAAHIRDWNMGKGTKIKIRKGGDVIPVIADVRVNENVIPIFPEEYDWYWKSRDIILDEIDSNREVQIARITHFFQTIGAKGIGPKTIEKFWESGLNTIKKVTQAPQAKIMKLKGFGKKKSQNIYDAIRMSLRTTPPDRYIVAITDVPLSLGRPLIKLLIRVFPDLLEKKLDSEQISSRMKKLKKENKLPGFGPKRIANVANEIPRLRDLLFDINEEDIQHAMVEQKNKRISMAKKGYDPKLHDKTFVMSGWMNNTPYNLEDMIYDNMGKISSTVTSSTSAVVVPSIGSITSKMEMAHSLGIPVMTHGEFQNYLDN